MSVHCKKHQIYHSRDQYRFQKSIMYFQISMERIIKMNSLKIHICRICKQMDFFEHRNSLEFSCLSAGRSHSFSPEDHAQVESKCSDQCFALHPAGAASPLKYELVEDSDRLAASRYPKASQCSKSHPTLVQKTKDPYLDITKALVCGWDSFPP